MNEPIGSASVGPLFIRLALGSYLVLAGLLKLDNLDAFINVVQSLSLFPKQIALVLATVVPYLEVASGALLVLGLWTTLSSGIVVLLLTGIIYIFGVFPKGSAELFNKDFILLAAAASLLYTGAGAASIDGIKK